MGTSRPRVLFVSHSATRNGATILLLQELAWLRTRVDWDFEILVRGHGALIDDFRAIAKTTVWRDLRHTLDTLLRGRLPRLQRLIEDLHARCTLPGGRYDLVYCNTSALARDIPCLARGGTPVLWHIHELAYALKVSVKPEHRMAAVRSTTRAVAVSAAVRQAIESQLGIPAARVDVVNGFVPLDANTNEADDVRRRRGRALLNLDPESFVVGACGAPGWRKGSDLFLQIAARLRDTTGPVHFLWVGGTAGSREHIEFAHDMKALGLKDRCQIVPDTGSVSDLYAAMDVFALTSREDPFPLVMLEASRHRLPWICFRGAGGADELVAAGAGIAVPYLDVNSFAKCITKMHVDAAFRARMGHAARAGVEREHTADAQCPKLLRAMLACMPAQHAMHRARPSPTSQ